MNMTDWAYRYKTIYFKTEEDLEKFKKEQGDKGISDTLHELIEDGYKYRQLISKGDWVKK